jgi:hypothetical protein
MCHLRTGKVTGAQHSEAAGFLDFRAMLGYVDTSCSSFATGQCVCVCLRVCVCVCVCLCATERERESERARESGREKESICWDNLTPPVNCHASVCLCVCVCV